MHYSMSLWQTEVTRIVLASLLINGYRRVSISFLEEKLQKGSWEWGLGSRQHLAEIERLTGIFDLSFLHLYKMIDKEQSINNY